MNSREKMDYDYERSNQIARKVNIAAIVLCVVILGLLVVLAIVRS